MFVPVYYGALPPVGWDGLTVIASIGPHGNSSWRPPILAYFNFSQGDHRMTLNTRAFVIAQVAAVALFYVVCLLLVTISPTTAMSILGNLFHMDLSGAMTVFTLGGAIVGLLVATIGWGLLSLIMVRTYNSLIRNTP